MTEKERIDNYWELIYVIKSTMALDFNVAFEKVIPENGYKVPTKVKNALLKFLGAKKIDRR